MKTLITSVVGILVCFFLIDCKKTMVDTNGEATGFAEIKNVRITATRIVFGSSLNSASSIPPGSDSCLVNLRTGKVYALKDGASNGANVDVLFNVTGNSQNPDAVYWASSDYYKLDESTFGSWIKQWSTYRNTQIQDWYDHPISLSEWNTIKTAADINRVNKESYSPVNGSTTGITLTLLAQKSLYAFITPEGRRGIMKFTGYGKKTSTLYWITFDIKIQQ